MQLRHSLGISWRLSICNTVLLLIVAHLHITYALFTRNDCNELTANSQCQCSPAFGNFEIDCPAGTPNPKIHIQLHPELQIVIECNLSIPNYQLLPHAQIGNIEHVKIKECPLPGHTPIAGILETLGIKAKNSLHFESKNFGANITRKHLSRLQSIQRLRLSSRSRTYLPADLFMDLPNLKWLDLRSNEALPVDIFTPLENLEFLELAYNRFTELPHGIFRKQHKLHDLNLWSNELRNLSKYVFEGATALSVLDLTANGIETFQPDVFQFLPKLNTISMNANHIRELPAGIFEYNKNLSQIHLDHNRISLSTLPPALLADQPNLKFVSFICGLETVPADLFAKSIAITNISLSGNNLTALPEKLFADQVNLLNLNLHGNRLQSLPDHIFKNTKSLEALDLSDNKLTQITNEIFYSLVNLKTLNLEHNQLTTISLQAFETTKQLHYINLADNDINLSDPIHAYLEEQQIREIGSPFRNLDKLETLILRNNSIMYLFDDWKYTLLNLQQLDLSHNNITTLNSQDLQYLSKKQVHVNLTYNQINEINFLNLMLLNNTIVEMDLNNNPIDCNCVLLNFVQFVRKEIHSLNDGNRINLLTEELTCETPARLKGKNVRDVDPKQLLCPLDHDSKQKRCPSGCECWVRTYDLVLMVNCSNGNLTRVPALPRLEPLKLKATELYVENNEILKLPKATTPGYADVTKIYAAGNNISKVVDYNLPYGLTDLDLRHNQLSYLNDSALKMLNESLFLQSLQLSGNPWHCNCLARPFLVLTQNKYKLIKDMSELDCAWPKHVKKLQYLTVNDICPVDKTLVIAVAVVISLIGFLVGITAALYYKYQLEIKVWLYAHNLCLWLVTEEELDKEKKYDGFVSYSHHDKEFVENYLVPQLENGTPPFKLCVHERDFLVGGRIAEQIVQNIDDSRRTLVVLSKHFIESMWGRMEFQTAHKSALTEGRARVIVIIYGDIGDTEQLDTELKAYLKMNTYLKWGDPWFWDKLRYAMPHPANKLNSLVKTSLKGSTDDKLELIKPTPVSPTLTTPPAEATKNPLVAHLNGGTPQTAVMIPNGKLPAFYTNGKVTQNGHVNGAFIINTNAKQSDV